MSEEWILPDPRTYIRLEMEGEEYETKIKL